MKIEITSEIKKAAITEFTKSFIALTCEIRWMIACPIFDEQERQNMAEDAASFLNRFAEKHGFFKGNPRTFEEQQSTDKELTGILLGKK